MKLETGYKYFVKYGENNINNQSFHVLAFVEGIPVVRQWSRRWQCWQYKCLSLWDVDNWFSKKMIKKTGKITQLEGE